MIEDQLTHAQRVRLEALAQVAGAGLHHLTPDGKLLPDLDDVLSAAETVEAWLLEAADRDVKADGREVPGTLEQLEHRELGPLDARLFSGRHLPLMADVDAFGYRDGAEVIVTLPARSAGRRQVLLDAAHALESLAGTLAEAGAHEERNAAGQTVVGGTSHAEAVAELRDLYSTGEGQPGAGDTDRPRGV